MEFGRTFIPKCFLPRDTTSLFPAGCKGPYVGWSTRPTTGIHGRNGSCPRSPPSMLRFDVFGKGGWSLLGTASLSSGSIAV